MYLYEDNYLDGTQSRSAEPGHFLGTMFRVNVETSSPGGRVFKPLQQGAATGHPDQARLYNFDTGALMDTVNLNAYTWPADTAWGWVPFLWSTNMLFVTGARYVVLYRTPAGYGYAYRTGAPAMPASGSFIAGAIGPASNVAAYSANQLVSAFTTIGAMTFFSDHRTGADIWIGADEPTPAPDVDANLASWLSTSAETQTHEADGLPFRTDATATRTEGKVDLLQTATDAIQTILDNVPKLDDPAWVDALKLWQIAGALTELEVAAWNLFAKRSPSQLTGPSGGGGSAFFGPGGHQVAASAEEAVEWGARLWHRTETSNWLTAVPGTDWVLQDTLEYSGKVGWNQPADW